MWWINIGAGREGAEVGLLGWKAKKADDDKVKSSERKIKASNNLPPAAQHRLDCNSHGASLLWPLSGVTGWSSAFIIRSLWLWSWTQWVALVRCELRPCGGRWAVRPGAVRGGAHTSTWPCIRWALSCWAALTIFLWWPSRLTPRFCTSLQEESRRISASA